VEALVIVGGDGSQTGSLCLHKKGFPLAGCATTTWLARKSLWASTQH